MKFLKTILIILLVALVVIQFIPVEKNIQDNYTSVVAFEAETNMPENIKAIMRKDCYDCHSNQTVYPWYAQIAPANFFLADHVEEGKEHLNFSGWNEYSAKRKDHKLDELIEEVEEGEMPLESYTWVHGTITEEEKESLISWAKLARQVYTPQLQTTKH